MSKNKKTNTVTDLAKLELPAQPRNYILNEMPQGVKGIARKNAAITTIVFQAGLKSVAGAWGGAVERS